jgi:hypothetical protein
MNCPVCGKKNVTAGHITGHGAAGKPKRFSAAEIARRTARIQKYNAERKKVAAVGAKRSDSSASAGREHDYANN